MHSGIAAESFTEGIRAYRDWFLSATKINVWGAGGVQYTTKQVKHPF